MVERCDYSSDGEFRQAQQQEEEYYQRQQQERQNQEPDVVPCYLCGCQMYEENTDPKYNICVGCNTL